MLLSFSNVSLEYGDGRKALDSVSFVLPPGGFYILAGPSGAGKSSLLKLIYGAARANSGSIFLFDRDIEGLDRAELADARRRIGIVFQDGRLVPYLSVMENTALPLRLTGADEDYIQRHARELLTWVGLGDRLDAKPSELSGGEQQRAAIARAVVAKPALMLADEPTGNIDDETALRLMHLFNELNKMGTAVIIATHQQHLVERFKKPVLRLQAGRLVSPATRAA